MINKLKHTLKHSFVYSLGNFAVKIIGLLLLPLYTSYLTTAQYGILALLETTALFLTAIFALNISEAMMRWWADSKDPEKQKTYVFTGFATLLFLIVLLNVLLQPFASKFATIFFEDTNFKVYFNILFLSVALDIMNKYALSLIRILEKSYLFIIVNSLKLIVILVLNIYFIVSLEFGVKGIILAQLIGHLLGFILLLPFMFKNFVFNFDFKELKNMLAYSIPLAFTTLSMVFLNMGDRYVLKFIEGDAELGIYSLAYKIAGFLNFFVLQSFQMGFLPIAYKMYKEENSGRFFSKVMTYLIIILTFGALGLALFTPEFVRIFSPQNKDFWEASNYVGAIGIAVILFGIRFMLALNFHISKKTAIVPFIVSFFAVLNIFLNIITIPYYGIFGVIFSSILVTVFMNIAYYHFGRKHYKVNYEVGKGIIIIFVGIGLFALTFLFGDLNFWVKILLKLIICSFFPLIIIFGGFLEPIEKERLGQIWNKWNNPFLWKYNLKELSKKSKQNKEKSE